MLEKSCQCGSFKGLIIAKLSCKFIRKIIQQKFKKKFGGNYFCAQVIEGKIMLKN